jgi:hypothetical protein
MSPEVTVAIITAIGGIIIATIAAYNSAREASKKELKDAFKICNEELAEIRRTITVNELKVNTLWEIYAEDAIRAAQKGGLLASQSSVRPTEKLSALIPLELQEILASEAISMYTYLSSPYDIAIELWIANKKFLACSADEIDMPLRDAWAGVVTIVYNALYDAGKISDEEVPIAMLH